MINLEPPRINTSERRNEAQEVDRIEVFEIDGRKYTMPAKLSPAAGMRYLRNLRDRGRDYAEAQLLTEALGSEAVDALAECDEITHDEMATILAIVMRIALGAADPGKGSRKKGRR